MARNSINSNEPNALLIDHENEDYTTRIIRAMNWYSAEKLKSDARSYIREYVKKNLPSDLKTFDDIKDNDIRSTYGWIARLITHGAKLREFHLIDFNRYLTEILNSVESNPKKVIPVVVVTNKVSIQDAILAKASEYIGELEGQFDEVIKVKQDFSLYNSLKGNQIPKPYMPMVRDWVEKKANHFTEAYSGTDAQLVEGYSNLTKVQFRNTVKMLNAWLEDCDKYSEFKKANRKIRVSKPKAPGIQVKNLKYKKADDELKLTSVSPTDIVGAQQVWLFNTKNRKLVCYKTDSATGIQVKGTSLQNYQPDICAQKTLRKPADTIKELMSASKVQLRKFMDSINSKAQSPNGRLNEEMIILKVVK
jgi:hypothetical protein